MSKLKRSVKYAGPAVLFGILMGFNLSVGLNEKVAGYGGLSLQSLAVRIFVPTANAYQDKGGGGGGGSLWIRFDQACSRTTTYTVVIAGYLVTVTETRQGTEVHCYGGGNEACIPQPCNA